MEDIDIESLRADKRIMETGCFVYANKHERDRSLMAEFRLKRSV
jgi:hypothetical protein